MNTPQSDERFRKLVIDEINHINRVLAAHGVQARTQPRLTLCVRSSFVAYGLRMAPGESIKRVESIHRELSNELSRLRTRHGFPGAVPVRVRDYPLAIETPHPQPMPLDWRCATLRLPRGKALIGKSYSFDGASDQFVDLEHDHHVLVAAMSGGGKSTLMRMALASLALNTSPEKLRVLLVDLKNDDLVPFQAMPHVIGYAGDIEAAAGLIASTHELRDARIAGQARDYRLLLVIDELAELGERKETLAQLGRILSTGRSLGINVWAGTQYPVAAAIGSIVSRSFTVRLVGRVDGAQAAHVATQRPGTGAHLLALPGDFLRVDGPELVRLKAYNLGGDAAGSMIAAVCERWGTEKAEGGRQKAEGSLSTANSLPHAASETDVIADTIRPLWLGGASLAEMIRSIYGPHANTGGANRSRVLAAVDRLKTTTTTATTGATTGGGEAGPAGSSSDGDPQQQARFAQFSRLELRR